MSGVALGSEALQFHLYFPASAVMPPGAAEAPVRCRAAFIRLPLDIQLFNLVQSGSENLHSQPVKTAEGGGNK